MNPFWIGAGLGVAITLLVDAAIYYAVVRPRHKKEVDTYAQEVSSLRWRIMKAGRPAKIRKIR